MQDAQHFTGNAVSVYQHWRGESEAALAVCQSRPFAGVPDPLALVPPPALRGFFVLPAPPEFPEETGFLQLPFQQPQSPLDIVVMHRDGQHGLPSRLPGRAGGSARARNPRSAVMVYGSDPYVRVGAMMLSVRGCSTST